MLRDGVINQYIRDEGRPGYLLENDARTFLLPTHSSSIYLPIHLPTHYLHTHLPTYVPTHLATHHPSTYLPTYLPTNTSFHRPTYLITWFHTFRHSKVKIQLWTPLMCHFYGVHLRRRCIFYTSPAFNTNLNHLQTEPHLKFWDFPSLVSKGRYSLIGSNGRCIIHDSFINNCLYILT